MSTGTYITQQLREACEEAIEQGWSVNGLAKAAGISQPSLQRWLSGARASLSEEAINKLCLFFGSRLTKPRIPKPNANR